MIRYNYYQQTLHIHITSNKTSTFKISWFDCIIFKNSIFTLISYNTKFGGFFKHLRKSDSVKSLGFISNQCIAGNFLPTCPNPPSTREITQHNSKSRKCDQTQTVFTKGVAHCLY